MTAPASRRPADDDTGSVAWTLLVATMLAGVIGLAGVPFAFDVVRGALIWWGVVK